MFCVYVNVCMCVCPVYRLGLICGLSNRDARTEIKSRSRGPAPRSPGESGFRLMSSESGMAVMAGGGERVEVLGGGEK